MKQTVTRGASLSWFLVVFDAEQNVEEVCRNQDKVESKDCRPANLGRVGQGKGRVGQDKAG